MLSHELRTPLTPVLMSAGAMELDPSLPVHIREELGVIRRNIELEAKLIDDLLDLTRISQGKLKLDAEVTDAHELLRQAYQMVCGDASAKRLSVSLDLSAGRHCVRGDPARLQQVFWNVIKNAVKFTPAGGTIAILTEQKEQGRLQIQVRDSGIGISMENLPRIFDAFEQGAASVTRRFGGLGLGLCISKAILEMHGGALCALSDGPGTGATFTMDLATVAERPAIEKGDTTPQLGSMSPLRILLVEDHESTAHVMSRLLQELGHEVRTAPDLQTALATATSDRFDLLISDLGLPDGSGLELMRQLRTQYNLKGIAVSGFGMEEDVQKSIEAGFAAHLTKPITLPKLEQVIQEVSA
jgi:CheY-like chemotaxis protein